MLSAMRSTSSDGPTSSGLIPTLSPPPSGVIRTTSFVRDSGIRPRSPAMRSPFGSRIATPRPAAMSAAARLSSTVVLPVPVGPSRCRWWRESATEMPTRNRSSAQVDRPSGRAPAIAPRGGGNCLACDIDNLGSAVAGTCHKPASSSVVSSVEPKGARVRCRARRRARRPLASRVPRRPLSASYTRSAAPSLRTTSIAEPDVAAVLTISTAQSNPGCIAFFSIAAASCRSRTVGRGAVGAFGAERPAFPRRSSARRRADACQ